MDRYSGATYASPRDTVLAADTWTHVAAVYDGATLRLYRNGTQTATAAAAWSMPALTCTVTLGGTTSGGTTNWIGGVDEAAVYPSALSATQVMLHYQRRA